MTFEFDDVINTAKVIVNPEQSAAELKRLGIENAQLRKDLDEMRDALAGARPYLYALRVSKHYSWDDDDTDALSKIDAVLGKYPKDEK